MLSQQRVIYNPLKEMFFSDHWMRDSNVFFKGINSGCEQRSTNPWPSVHGTSSKPQHRYSFLYKPCFLRSIQMLFYFLSFAFFRQPDIVSDALEIRAFCCYPSQLICRHILWHHISKMLGNICKAIETRPLSNSANDQIFSSKDLFSGTPRLCGASFLRILPEMS